jgi:hypothetical protein
VVCGGSVLQALDWPTFGRGRGGVDSELVEPAVTAQEWDEWVTGAISRLTGPPRKLDLRTARVIALQVAEARFGARPPDPPSPVGSSGLGLIGLLKLALKVRSSLKMGFKFSVTTIVVAIGAAASAFGAAYTAANLDNVVTTGEWVSILWAVVTAVVAVFFHDSTPPAVK